jgi:hypothetical protein
MDEKVAKAEQAKLSLLLRRRNTAWALDVKAQYVQVRELPPWAIKTLQFFRTETFRLMMAVAVCTLNIVRDQLSFRHQFIFHTQIVTMGLITDTCFVLLQEQIEYNQVDYFAIAIIMYGIGHLVTPIMLSFHGMATLEITHVVLCSATHVLHYIHVYMFCKSRSVISSKTWSLLLLEIMEALVNATLFHKSYFRPLSAATLSFLVYHTAFKYSEKHQEQPANDKKEPSPPPHSSIKAISDEDVQVMKDQEEDKHKSGIFHKIKNNKVHPGNQKSIEIEDMIDIEEASL